MSKKIDQRALHRETVAGKPFAVDEQGARGDAREVVAHAEAHGRGACEVCPVGEERAYARRDGVGHDKQFAGGASRGRDGAVGVFPAYAGEPSLGVAGGQHRVGMQVFGDERPHADRHCPVQRRGDREDAVAGREDEERRIGRRGGAAFSAAENRFVERSGGDACRDFAPEADDARPPGGEHRGGAVGFGTETLRPAEDVEFQL